MGGVVECVTHKLIEPFQVLFDKEGAYVAQYKFTVLLMPNGPHKITGLPFDEEEGKKHAAVKFGASTLNLHYYDWALANNWTMPANTIMHYMSIGGVALGTCHGGGIGHQTIADRILELEYVDALGELQVINDPELLKVIGGSMGMLGIVTSLTYKLDEMTYARFWPQHTWRTGVYSAPSWGSST